MSQDLLLQLTEYGTYCEERQGSVEANDVIGSVVPMPVPVRSTRPVRGWLPAVAAAALILILIGGLALLAPFGGGAPVVNEPMATTVPEEVVDTTVPADDTVTRTTEAATSTTLAAIVSLPAGEGPKLLFVQAEAPTDGELGDGEWFKGALYVLRSGDLSSGDNNNELYRSTDGLTWESVPGLPEASGIRRTMLQSDSDRLVNVVMPRDGNRGIAKDASIQVNTSTNGVDWISSRITLPIPVGLNMAGEFQLDDSFFFSDNFAVGPKGIVVTATIDLVFEGEGFANGLVGPDDGIHVEVVDLDIERGVIVVRFLDEENDMQQIGDLREIDLETAGFSNLLDAMAADPDWERLVPGFLAQLTIEGSTGFAFASVGYAWFSPNGVDWQRIDSTGPLDGGEFAAIIATPDGFVATASSPYPPSELPPEVRYLSESFDSGVVWQSADGTTWTEATDLTTRHGFNTSRLVEWRGELVEQLGWARRRGDDTMMWTLADPSRRTFSEVPTDGMLLEISEFGLIGTPTYGWEEPGTMEILFSVDGTNWNRWEPTEVGQGDAWIVGVGNDFVVVQVREFVESGAGPSYSLWVGRVP